MSKLDKETIVAVIGSGAMGSGIAQVAAMAGHNVLLFDNNTDALDNAMVRLGHIMDMLVTKGKYSANDSAAILKRIKPGRQFDEIAAAGLVIEAIIEDLDAKKNLLSHLEIIVDETCIIGSNTSSLSIASICAACAKPERVIGIHFFNPAPLMPLVEVVPGIQTSGDTLVEVRNLIDSWGKITVTAKDTPGFIVNRVARPFYGEALRIYEEGIADIATIDWAVKEIGGFRMGPFELMDYIGNDINYTVTETVFQAFYYDPRYRPAFTQKRMVEAGWLGRKSERGYYDYREGALRPEPTRDMALGKTIVNRLLVMLINEAADALYLNISSRDGLELAMTKGVNYPKGLLQWADELGVDKVLSALEHLQQQYGEDRYRPSLLLRHMVRDNLRFYPEKIMEN